MFTQEQLQTALSRHEIIAPLLHEGLEPAEKRKRRCEIMQKYEISDRSLRRYIAAYGRKSFGKFLSSKNGFIKLLFVVTKRQRLLSLAEPQRDSDSTSYKSKSHA